MYTEVESMVFPSLPVGFQTTPTLNWKVFSAQAITTDCEVAYRTTGFKWKSDYTVILSPDEKNADVGGWVTIDNNSGKRYIDAKLKLIAGDVNIVRDQPQIRFKSSVADTNSTFTGGAPSFSEKSFSDFHMYTLS